MKYILKIDCQDKKGLVYKISKAIFESNLNIETSSEFVDKEHNKFFFRATFFYDFLNKTSLVTKIKNILNDDINIEILEENKKDIIIFVTKEAHALGDLLIRNYTNKINANIVAVISNHKTLEGLVQKFNIPYHFLNTQDMSREAHEDTILDMLNQYKYDYLVLAKYMRILSSSFVDKFNNQIINIHHSFLPSFVGANPYLQAYNRGVKTIGATSHFVTNNLDEGPIIFQDTTKVGHAFDARDMKREGAKVETLVLSKALDLVFEDRVFIHSNKTIIL